MKYMIIVITRTSVLHFPNYTETEYVSAATTARDASRKGNVTEVRDLDTGKARVRYCKGRPLFGFHDPAPPNWADDLRQRRIREQMADW